MARFVYGDRWLGVAWAYLAALVLTTALLPNDARAAFKPGYASIVIDAETGAVLSETNADVPHYPASLTKMMTLYLVFEALETGRLSFDQRLAVSEAAANQSPTRLGLVAGDTVAVRDVVLGLITRSANDAAVVAAEAVAGSEAAFAQRMTQKARALGMSGTVFRNASGLPDPQQITTARDLATLGRALYRDYPTEYGFFATQTFAYKGTVIANHNHLMKHFAGMDGIKTGYIRASGFNLAASAVRDNRRLIGIVMGGPSPYARDLKMAMLLNDGFARGAGAATTEVADASDAPPDEGFTGRAKRALRHISPVSSAEAAPAIHHRTRHSAAAAGDHYRWTIQVGAFSERAAAQRAALAAIGRLPNGKRKSIEVVAPGDNESFYRARILNFSSREAERACRTLHRQHKDCAVIPPGAVHLASG